MPTTHSRARCPTSQCQPIRGYGGRIIGTSDGVVFRKTIKGSLHLLRCPPAIAIDAEAYDIEIAPSHQRIEVYDMEAGRTYSASIETFDSLKGELDRGFGRQYFVTLNHWHVEGNGDGQLRLWEDGSSETS